MSDHKPPQFPYVAALLCVGCIGAAVWTWMRYSYAWDVTPSEVPAVSSVRPAHLLSSLSLALPTCQESAYSCMSSSRATRANAQRSEHQEVTKMPTGQELAIITNHMRILTRCGQLEECIQMQYAYEGQRPARQRRGPKAASG